MSELICGIDPGMRGAFCLLDRRARIVRLQTLESISHRIDRIISHDIILVVLERAQSMPRQGIAAAFNYGWNFGELCGLLKAKDAHVELVSPGVWHRAVLRGISSRSKVDPKKMALKVAQRLWPAQTWLASNRSSVPHDGLVDAALIAYHGYMTREKISPTHGYPVSTAQGGADGLGTSIPARNSRPSKKSKSGADTLLGTDLSEVLHIEGAK